VNAKQKRQLDNQLLAMGLARLDDPELIGQLAALVSEWRGDRHEFLQDLLNECDADKRSEMYNAIAPKLTFKPLSLPQYECRIAEKAGRMVSQRRARVEGSAPKPIEIGGHQVQITTPDQANCGWVIVRCHKCGVEKRFLADTPVGAIIEARKAGWRKDPGVNLELCPECPETTKQPLVLMEEGNA
jgi:hypothetical protein